MLLVIRETQIKIRMRYHLTTEWPSSKNLQTIIAGEGIITFPPTLLEGMQTSTATMENSVEIP